jgi:hypothetical protein
MAVGGDESTCVSGRVKLSICLVVATPDYGTFTHKNASNRNLPLIQRRLAFLKG